MKWRCEAASELWNILFIAFSLGGDFRTNRFFKVFPQEVGGVDIDKETEINDVGFIFIPGMGCHSCLVMLKKVSDFAMLTNFSEGNVRVNSVEDCIFGLPALLGVPLFEV